MIKTIRDLGLAIYFDRQGDTGKIGFRANVDLPFDSEISWYENPFEAPAFLIKTLGIPFYYTITNLVPDPQAPAFFRRRREVAKSLGYKLNGRTTAGETIRNKNRK